MKHWFLTALSSTLCVAEAFAAPCPAPGEDGWAKLDRELESLVIPPSSAALSGPTLSALVRARWALLQDVFPGHEDFNGFSLDRVQVALDGKATERIGYRVEFEAAGGTARLLDAYANWEVNRYVRVCMGNFRAPLVWESQLHDGDILFLVRTDVGELFYARDEGAMIDGSIERFHWAVSLQNGIDSVAERYAACVRVGFDVLDHGVGLHQGAYGAGSGTKLTVGAGLYDDDGVGGGNDGSVFTADAQLQAGRFAADATYTKFGDDNNVLFVNRADANAWSTTVSYMAVEDKVEVAARYQETDNVFDESDATLGVNYYLIGHDVKLQFNVVNISSDDPVLDDTWRFGVGVNVRV